MYRKEKEMQFTPEKMNTEGDTVLVPVRCSSRIIPPRPKWNPFTERVTFYDPEDHAQIAYQLQDAPVQSGEIHAFIVDEEVKE